MSKHYLRFPGGKSYLVMNEIPRDRDQIFYFLFMDKEQMLSYFNMDVQPDLLTDHCLSLMPSKLGMKKLGLRDAYYFILLCQKGGKLDCGAGCEVLCQYEEFKDRGFVILMEDKALDGEIHDVSLDVSPTFRSYALDRMVPISYTPFAFHHIPLFESMNSQALSFGAENQFSIAFLEGDHITATPNLGHVEDLIRMEEMDRMVKAVMGHLHLSEINILRGLNNYSLVADYLRSQRHVKKLSNLHAHLAATMYDNKNTKEKGIGVVYDTTAFDSNGEMVGGEILYGSIGEFETMGQWTPVPLPGGVIANIEPWRITMAIIKEIYQGEFRKLELPLIQKIKDNERQKYLFDAIDYGHMTYTMSSSMHHIISALGELLWYEETIFDIHFFESLLNEMADTDSVDEPYDSTISLNKGVWEIDTNGLFKNIIANILAGEKKENMMNRAVQNIVNATADVVDKISKKTKCKKVYLSGDFFRNTNFLSMVFTELEKRGMEVFINRDIPYDDSCLAVGQLILDQYSEN